MSVKVVEHEQINIYIYIFRKSSQCNKEETEWGWV